MNVATNRPSPCRNGSDMGETSPLEKPCSKRRDQKQARKRRNCEMAVMEVVKLDVGSDDFIVQKYVSENQWELRLGSQLVVNEGQEAIFVKGGVALDIFTAGTHTLVSQNIPLLSRLLKLPYGGTTPFTAEVWFVNKTVKRNLRWGTPHRIPVIEPTLGYPINIGACGQWGFRIDDSRSFVRQIVGAQLGADSQKVQSYFIGEILEKFALTISSVVGGGMPFFEVSTKLDQVSAQTVSAIKPEFERFGIELVNFSTSSINIAPHEMAKIQAVMGTKMEMRQLGGEQVGQGYLTAKSFEVIGNAAKNQNSAGAIVGAFAGLGMGQGVALPIGQSIARNANGETADVETRLAKLKSLYEKGLVSKDEYDSKRAALIEML